MLNSDMPLLLKTVLGRLLQDTRFRSLPSLLSWLGNADEVLPEDAERITRALTGLGCQAPRSTSFRELSRAIIDCYENVITRELDRLRLTRCVDENILKRLDAYGAVVCSGDQVVFTNREGDKMIAVARREDGKVTVAYTEPIDHSTIANMLEKLGGGVCYWYDEDVTLIDTKTEALQADYVTVMECTNSSLNPKVAAVAAGLIITRSGSENVEAELVYERLKNLLEELKK